MEAHPEKPQGRKPACGAREAGAGGCRVLEAADVALGPVLTEEKLAGLILAAAPRKVKGCRVLDISQNKIRKLGVSVGEIVNLGLESVEDLNLRGNLLRQLDGRLVTFPRLARLDVSENVLSQILNFETQFELRELALQGNRLKEINGLAPSPLHHTLEWLDISRNDIADLRGLAALVTLEELRELDVRDNPVELHPLQGDIVLEGFCMLACPLLETLNGRRITAEVRDAVICWSTEDPRGRAVTSCVHRFRQSFAARGKNCAGLCSDDDSVLSEKADQSVCRLVLSRASSSASTRGKLRVLPPRDSGELSPCSASSFSGRPGLARARRRDKEEACGEVSSAKTEFASRSTYSSRCRSDYAWCPSVQSGARGGLHRARRACASGCAGGSGSHPRRAVTKGTQTPGWWKTEDEWGGLLLAEGSGERGPRAPGFGGPKDPLAPGGSRAGGRAPGNFQFVFKADDLGTLVRAEELRALTAEKSSTSVGKGEDEAPDAGDADASWERAEKAAPEHDVEEDTEASEYDAPAGGARDWEDENELSVPLHDMRNELADATDVVDLEEDPELPPHAHMGAKRET
ncbi:leucine rich repeat-containing protein [Besnoitia besnoiti]|uniref:Leucine rich repeat-containing protein n=1 Tax=Besnoitia besnoiti TaxID=94643 RepID=A0A2A9M619_BESBE|nr:leucine rich repeat-containing protein [Besnoitia besnoiti]PFH33405.1 leucine rich repeat-containing protein [Besnoitia besnoiti]